MIAMTRGQLRRRWLVSLLTLLAIMPWWMWAGSALVDDSDGSVYVTDDGVAGEDCNTQCCDNCGPCVAGSSCADCGGNTPTEWTVVFVNVENAAACMDCTAVHGGSFSGGTGSLGTYTVTQQPFPLLCLWQLDTTGPTWHDGATAADCSDVVLDDNLQVRVAKTTGFVSVAAASSSVVAPGTTNDGAWFEATIAVDPDDCCATYTLNNELVAYTCSTADGVAGVAANIRGIGRNGSVTISPCS